MIICIYFSNTIFVSNHMYRENRETQVIVGSMNMGYDIISDTARNRTHNLFHLKCVPIPLGLSGDIWRNATEINSIQLHESFVMVLIEGISLH